MKLNRIVLTLCIVAAMLCFCACSGQQKDSLRSIVETDVGKKLDTLLTPYVEDIIASYDLPGLALGVVKDNEIIYARALGYLNIETREPLTLTSMFHMASVSKPFVATAIVQLVEQQKIHLDSAVVTYLPYFSLDDPRYKNITIRHMLNHISGMPDVQDYEWDKPEYDEGALEQYVRSIASEKMRSAPGESFAYSNMAFECLGDVIAKVSGKPFADYVKKHILEPSGMQESTFLKPDHLPENWAAPHIRFVTTEVWDGYPYNRMHGPSSTLHSNVIEMCNWALTNLNRGTFEGNEILLPGSYDLLWKRWFQNGEDSYVGLSWFLGKFRDENTVGHSGGDMGFNTDFVMLPEQNISIVVLCNFIPAPVRNIKFAAMDILLGHEPHAAPVPASIPVGREMENVGLESAVEMWDSLKNHHPEKYDFGPQQFMGLIMAMNMDRVEEAQKLTMLFVRIFPENTVNVIKGMVENYFANNTDSRAAPAMLEIIQNNTKHNLN